MSYCRFLEADAYIYDDIYYGLYCCGCSLKGSFIAEYDYDKMLAHIAEHRTVGDYIPEYVDEALIEDRDATDKKNI